MTPGANHPSQAERDNLFSERLIKHARSLSLTNRVSVGPWDYGQGVRKARGDQFFWDLTKKNFQPLGLNHPTTLTSDIPLTLTAQSFRTDLQLIYPQLKDWRWTLLSISHPWLQPKSSHFFQEDDCTLKCDKGWLGFLKLNDISAWSVRLSDHVVWCASSNDLPSSDIHNAYQFSWLNTFLSADAIGQDGRLSELITILTEALRPKHRNGLNLKFSNQNITQWSDQGLACDINQEREAVCYFPLSILPEDIQGIASLVKE